jgi:hypothetical protein
MLVTLWWYNLLMTSVNSPLLNVHLTMTKLCLNTRRKLRSFLNTCQLLTWARRRAERAPCRHHSRVWRHRDSGTESYFADEATSCSKRKTERQREKWKQRGKKKKSICVQGNFMVGRACEEILRKQVNNTNWTLYPDWFTCTLYLV